MKKIVMVLLLLSLLVPFTSCTMGDKQLQSIQERGVLRVGVKVDVPNFGYLNPETNEMEGFEIDLAKALALEILGDENAVKFIGLSAETRGPLLDNGEVDIVIATFTITDERRQSFNFTDPYYVDQIGFLVGSDSGIATINDLNGRIAGVSQAGTAQEALVEECNSRGIQMTFSEFPSYPEIKAALADGTVDAFVADKSILTGYLDDQSVIIKEGFKTQDYGAAVAIHNKSFAQYIDSLLQSMKKDGSLDALYEKWGI